MQLVLITGLSGSGKSVALHVLEDLGFYCVDNLPASLLPDLVNLMQSLSRSHVAVSVDARSLGSVIKLPDFLATFKHAAIDVRLLYLDAQDDILINRFSETRRRHPLSQDVRTVEEAIALEREQLGVVSHIAHHIDTSALPCNALRHWIKHFVHGDTAGTLTLVFESFGFKRGLPRDADFVFDVRCLPNPYYDHSLRELTGLDQPVQQFLQDSPDTQHMLSDIQSFIERWLPSFISDNRSYLTIAIGCTGGQHRSVYLVECLGHIFQAQLPILLRHRAL